MTDRQKPHNGRDLAGRYGAPQEDVEELLENAEGVDVLREDVRHGGAVVDTGQAAGFKAREIAELIDENRDDVRRVTGGPDRARASRRRKG